MKPKQPRAPTTFDDQGYASHKGHYHDKAGKKHANRPTVDGDGNDYSTHPDEEVVEQTAVDIERKKARKGRRHLSTANTVLSNRGLG